MSSSEFGAGGGDGGGGMPMYMNEASSRLCYEQADEAGGWGWRLSAPENRGGGSGSGGGGGGFAFISAVGEVPVDEHAWSVCPEAGARAEERALWVMELRSEACI